MDRKKPHKQIDKLFKLNLGKELSKNLGVEIEEEVITFNAEDPHPYMPKEYYEKALENKDVSWSHGATHFIVLANQNVTPSHIHCGIFYFEDNAEVVGDNPYFPKHKKVKKK